MSIAHHMERKWRSVAKDVAPCLEVLPWNNSLFLQFSTHRDHPLKNEVNQGTVTRGLILKVKRQMWRSLWRNGAWGSTLSGKPSWDGSTKGLTLCDTGAQKKNSVNSNIFRLFLQSGHVWSIVKEGQWKQQNLTIAPQGFLACNCGDLLTWSQRRWAFLMAFQGYPTCPIWVI